MLSVSRIQLLPHGTQVSNSGCYNTTHPFLPLKELVSPAPLLISLANTPLYTHTFLFPGHTVMQCERLHQENVSIMLIGPASH